MRSLLKICTGAAILSAPGVSVAQEPIRWPRADSLSVNVGVELIEVTGDVVRLHYALTNDAGSQQAAAAFAIPTDLPIVEISGPPVWEARPTVIRNVAAAYWVSMRGESDVAPGETRTGFSYAAAGLVDIGEYHVRGHTELPKYDESEPLVAERPPSLWENSVSGLTLGIVPFPDDTSPGVLTWRSLRRLGRVCDLSWIDPRGACDSLKEKLDDAARSLARGQDDVARRQLSTFLDDLGVQRGNRVNENAYWLLKTNVEFVLSRIPQS